MLGLEGPGESVAHYVAMGEPWGRATHVDAFNSRRPERGEDLALRDAAIIEREAIVALCEREAARTVHG